MDTLHVVFNIEGGHSLYDTGNSLTDPEQALANLETFLNLGFLTLYMMPTHLTPNRYITHAYGNKILTKGPLLPQTTGISVLGKQLIDTIYSKGLLVDVKHMSLVSRLIFYQYRRRHYAERNLTKSATIFTTTNYCLN